MGSHGVFVTGLKKVSLAVMLAGMSANLQAIELLSGFGGDAGFGELAMLQNDDGSSNALNLPFNINFFGQDFSQFFKSAVYVYTEGVSGSEPAHHCALLGRCRYAHRPNSRACWQ
jgi:hypothetical protein